MAVCKTPSTIPGGWTPRCNECGVALCWDISAEEYDDARAFWDDWICQTCNDGTALSLRAWKETRARKQEHVLRVNTANGNAGMQLERHADDFVVVRKFLSDTEQEQLLRTIRAEILDRTTLASPLIGSNPMRLEMACAGDFVWRTQPRFHYEPLRDVPIPRALAEANDRACDAAGVARIQQETALVNLYRERNGRTPKLGLHRDQDEMTAALGLDEPAVISLSLGPASANFVIELEHKLTRLTLHGGDACFLVGRCRRARHGVESIDGAWRLNVTTRQIRMPQDV